MFCQDVALRGEELTNQQRATDSMFLGAWADMQGAMYKGLFGTPESKAAGMKALPAAVTRYMGGLEKQLPESGFVHGRDIPSIADLVIYNLMMSKFPGLLALKQDMSPFPRVASTTKAVELFMNPPLTIYYFFFGGRVEPARIALRMGGVKFNDLRSEKEGGFVFSDEKKNPDSFLFKHGFGSVPMLNHGDFWLPQG